MSAEAAGLRPAELRGLREQAERLGLRLPGLLVEAERVAATVAQGVHGRRRAGVGETFWQFRAYEPGDDAREIDWWQWAQLRQLYIREQEWEAAESVWLWADLSPSMRFNSERRLPTKLTRALLLLLGLASLLVRGGERVALLGSGERPRGGRFGLNRILAGLPAAAAQADVLPPQDRLPRNARLVLISDFLEPIEGLVGRLAGFTTAGITGCLLQLTDPAEEALPYAGRVLFEGLEREGRALVPNVGRVRDQYVQRFRAQREQLAALSGRQGWRFSTHRTDRSPESGLLTLYQMLAPKTVR
jgi:uncharacterized protein (DUF58 family)